MRLSLEETFLSKIIKTDSCWLWDGARSKGSNGDYYGTLRYSNKKHYAHKLSYLFFKGNLPKGMSVFHTCDNKMCVNPEHLLEGYHINKGSMHFKTSLDEKDVLMIRERRCKGESKIDIAQDYCISPFTVDQIDRRITWSHI